MTSNHKTFIDSNVLIYANDKDEPLKQSIAIQALDDLWSGNSGVLSVHVLQEFYWNITRKLRKRIDVAEARAVVAEYAEWCGTTTVQEVQAAFRIESEAHISFWDALIVACAQKNGATRILSEDLQHGQIIAGIAIVNPFREGEDRPAQTSGTN